jgi:mRNA interferase MazF
VIGDQLYRGVIYSVWLEYISEEKLFVVVSNNRRNKALDEALGVRITTSLKPDISSIVVIDPGEPAAGRVLCDDIEIIYPEDVRSTSGAFSQNMMAKIGVGLRAALDL